MSYVVTYKVAYLSLLLLELFLTYALRVDTDIISDRTMAYGIIIVAFTANLATGLAWLRGAPYAISMERALSAGRMIVSLTASTLLLGGLLTYSPLFLVFWRYVFVAATTWLPVLWIVCMVLFILEILYFKKLGGQPHFSAAA